MITLLKLLLEWSVLTVAFVVSALLVRHYGFPAFAIFVALAAIVYFGIGKRGKAK